MSIAPGVWSLGWTALSTIATVAAVSVALFVAVRDTKRLNRLRQREQEDRRREQAICVSAWATSESDAPGVPRSHTVGNPWFARIHLLNSSNSAIYDARVAIGYKDLNGEWYSLQDEHDWPVVPPGREIHADFSKDHIRNFSSPPHNTLLCQLSFRDANNVIWGRDARGFLSEAGSQSAPAIKGPRRLGEAWAVVTARVAKAKTKT